MGGADPVEVFSWAVVEIRGDDFEGVGVVNTEVAVLRKVLPK